MLKPIAATAICGGNSMSITEQQSEFIQSHDGDLSPEQASQLLDMALGDTAALPADNGNEPGITPENSEIPPGGGAGENALALDAANTVILAKDGKHTIGYEKLVEAREAEKQWKAAAQSAQAELEALKIQAQQRAIDGEAPTPTDNQLAAAQAAIDQGVDPGLFGDFSEEALANGIAKLVEQKVAAQVEARVQEALSPLAKQSEEKAVESHYNAIYTAHPDADSVAESQELQNWIDSQPSFLRNAYSDVFNQGTATQIIEMLDQFKQATGLQQAAPAKQDVRAAAQAAVKQAQAQVPTSLTDFPAGKPGAGVSRDERMDSLDSVDLLSEMQNMSPEQIEAFLNRRI